MPLPRLKFIIQEPRRTNASAWIELERILNALPEMWREGEILCLKDLRTLKFKETATDIIALAELQNETYCLCGASAEFFKKNGMTPPLMILDQPIRSKRVSIYYRARRHYCRSCRKTVRQSFGECADKHRLTNRLLAYIEEKSLSLYHSFSDIALETGVHEHVIRNLFTDYVVNLQKTRQIETPEWIAIDEVHPTTRRYTRCVISDPVRRCILDILPDNGIETVEKWLLQLPDSRRVKMVSMDLYAPYKKRVEHLLPDAQIVADRYHVQNLLNKSLREVLTVVRASLTPSEKRKQMRPEYLLLQNKEGHDLLVKNKYDQKIAGQKISREEKKKKINYWFREQPDIARAYTLKEDFANILQQSERRVADGRARVWLEQVADFSEYFHGKYEKQCNKLSKKPFGNVPKTINRWFDGILNYVEYKDEFSTKVTNAFAEYANNQIKQAHRRSNGYNFEVLRAKVIFGDFLKEKLLPHPLKAGTKRGYRKRLQINFENPNANVARLRRAREDSNKTKGLIPNPRENEACDNRLPHVSDTKLSQRPLGWALTRQNTVNTEQQLRPGEVCSKEHWGESRFEQMSLF